MRTVLFLSMFALASGVPAHAQTPDDSKAILVLDASGSMWGQIGGKSKIAIAREAVGTMLDGWKGGDLGLMAYGHRRKGDCQDIELLIEPGTAGAEAIARKVNALNPVGMTPISAAVRQAAEHLRFTERKATVILVSDGDETCHADPCAVGAELEAAGVDFTAHVIGFDLGSNARAREQLQCLARTTGGRYLDARDARELRGAMKSVAATPPAPAEPHECGRFVTAEPYLDGMATWPTGGTATDLAMDRREDFPPVELAPAAQPQECRALCEADAQCTAWWFESVGSNFREQPACFRWDASVALSPPQPGHPGSAMGVKPGVRQIVLKAGQDCADAEPEQGGG